MRFQILFGFGFLAHTINPTIDLANEIGYLFILGIVIGMCMDVVEFFNNLK